MRRAKLLEDTFFTLKGLMIFTLAVWAHCSFAQAQTADNGARDTSAAETAAAGSVSYAVEKGTNEFGVWGGGSFASPTLIGTAKEHRFAIAGLRYGRVFAASRNVAYAYTADVIPVAVVFMPDRNLTSFPPPGSGLTPVTFSARGGAVYGAGAAPIGFKVNFNRRGRTQPFVAASGGFLHFTRPVPQFGATQFNFTFDFGGGLQIMTEARRAFTVGSRYHHISNAYRNHINPGLDANLFYLGFSIFR